MAQHMSQAQLQAATEKAIEAQLIKAAVTLEDTLDEEIHRLDHINDDDLEAIRRRRLQQLKDQSRQRSEWQAVGHGVYSELPSEADFFSACKKSVSGLVCHFYRDSTFRCKIVDKHLTLLAPKHLECRMVKLNAEKSPFLTQRLGVCVIPTLILVQNEQIVDRIVGFDDLGGIDEFSTAMLEWRLAVGKVIKYAGDLSAPPDLIKRQPGSGSSTFTFADSIRRIAKNIRGKDTGDDEDSDIDD